MKEELVKSRKAIHPVGQQPPPRRPRGGEEMESEDRITPRLTICQPTSPQRKKGPKFIQGLKEGDYFNTVTQKVYGQSCIVVPLMLFKSRIRFKEYKKGGGILCIAQNYIQGVGDPGGVCLRCPFQLWKDNNPPECTKFLNYAVLAVKDGKTMPQLDDLMAFSMKSTAIKVAKQWNSLLTMRRSNINPGQSADWFEGIYKLTAEERTNERGTFYVPVIENAGYVDKAVFTAFEGAYLQVSELRRHDRIQVDVEDLKGGATEGEDPDAAGDAVEDGEAVPF